MPKRHAAGEKFWSRASKEKKELALGFTVLVKTQKGHTKVRWETSGTMLDVLEHNSYLVKMDGSGRVSKRRRAFLKPMTAYNIATGRCWRFKLGLLGEDIDVTCGDKSLVNVGAARG